MTAAPLTSPVVPEMLVDVDWRPAVKWGSIGALIAVFVAVVGMVEAFSGRHVIDPILGLGYVALLWIPIAYGFKASFRPAIEGLPAPETGAKNLLVGAAAGFISGAGLAGLIVFIDLVDVREIFPNISPRLFELLTYEESVLFGVVGSLALGALLGAVGGGLVLASSKIRKSILSTVLWVFVVGFMKVIIGQILREADDAAIVGSVAPDLSWLDERIYTDSRGITVVAAVVVAALAFSATYFLGDTRKQLRSRFRALPEQQRKTASLGVAVALIAVSIILPNIFGSFLNEILATAGLFLLLGLGLNIVIGFAGLLDLGYVAFFAVGAYVTAVFTSPISPELNPALPFWVVLPIVIIAAVLAGIVVGTPVIRMRGDYLAIVTLGFGEIARILLKSDWLKPVLGGAQGILQVAWDELPRASVINIREIYLKVGLAILAAGAVFFLAFFFRGTLGGSAAADTSGPGAAEASRRPRNGQFAASVAVVAALAAAVAWWLGGREGDIVVVGTNTKSMFFMILVFVLLATYMSFRLLDSRIGRAWAAMREDEQVAEAMGINIVTTKLLAFVIGAIFAALGGSLFAVKIGSIFPSSFELIVSIIVLVLIIVGGLGSIPGVWVGALVLLGVLGGPTQPGLLREFEEFKLLIYGTLLIYMMLKRPEGLWPSATRSRELHQEEVLQDAWLKGKVDDVEPAGAGA